MNPRRRRLGFIVAAVGMLAALILPLSSEAAAALPMRPVLLVLTVTAALIVGDCRLDRGSWAALPGFAGAVGAAVTTLELLRDPASPAPRQLGFWAMVLAVWLGAALCVTELASMRPTQRGITPNSRSRSSAAVWRAVVFYLWEVLVRGFGVSR